MVAAPPPGIHEDLARHALFFRYSTLAPHIQDDLAQRAPLFCCKHASAGHIQEDLAQHAPLFRCVMLAWNISLGGLQWRVHRSLPHKKNKFSV